MEAPVMDRIDGPKLRAFRLTRGLSQREVAIRAGLANETVNKIERFGGPKGVQTRTLYKLAGALEIPPDELLAGS
jgi:transcriptional regulator with XRE-family HTH domain